LVVALFKFVRDHELMETEELDSGVDTLIEAQQRIRTRVEAISRRLEARSIVEMNPGYKRMAEELPHAASAMIRAEALLDAQELSEALPQARKALSHLQRADAAFREVTVSQSQGGGGQNSDLTNLFRLELDKLRSQYADVKRATPGNAQSELDEVMRRLQELARRQQREIERARRRAEQGVTGSASQQQLAAELEELVRQLERLTRERQNNQLRPTTQQLQQAAEQMRQAGSGQGGADAEQQALRRLQQAQRQLAEDGRSQTAAAIGDAAQQAESLTREQQAVENELKDLQAGTGDPKEKVSNMLRRKQNMIRQTDKLESDLARLAQESRATQPEAAEKLRQALTGIRENTLTRRIERSGKRLTRSPQTYKPLHEEAINRELNRLQQRLTAAAGAVAESKEERVARAMKRLRGLIRERADGQRQMSSQAQRGTASGEGVADARAGGRLDGLGTRFDGDLVGNWSRADAEQLAMVADDLPLSGRMAQDIQNLIGALQRDATRQWQAADTAEMERVFSERLRQLQDIELDLRTAQEDAPSQPLATRDIQPRRADRDAVETYYRNLSESW
jgi:myosin heavy subunit